MRCIASDYLRSGDTFWVESDRFRHTVELRSLVRRHPWSERSN